MRIESCKNIKIVDTLKQEMILCDRDVGASKEIWLQNSDIHYCFLICEIERHYWIVDQYLTQIKWANIQVS